MPPTRRGALVVALGAISAAMLVGCWDSSLRPGPQQVIEPRASHAFLPPGVTSSGSAVWQRRQRRHQQRRPGSGGSDAHRQRRQRRRQRQRRHRAGSGSGNGDAGGGATAAAVPAVGAAAAALERQTG